VTFKFIDLFAGVGGIRLPFDELGGQCVFSSEWDRYAQKTYQANFGHIPNGDITKVPVKEIPSHNVLLGGFPCQPFSQAGHKKGFEDTRGTLFFDVARILDFHKPEMFLLENVKGFLGHDKGNTFQVIKTVLEDLNYSVFHKVLNARNFGVPQNRERIYIVGIHKTKLGKFRFDFPTELSLPTKLGMILEDSVDSKYTLSDNLWEGHRRRKAQHKLKGNGFGYSLFNSESRYTSTISARYYKDGSEILVEQIGKNPRKLTPREAARLQGFPDSFKIPVSDTQAYKQFGNSVAVPVIREIANQMVEILLNPSARKSLDFWEQELLIPRNSKLMVEMN
jgi:DNA (cytosine-5)-methyltransferase 1